MKRTQMALVKSIKLFFFSLEILFIFFFERERARESSGGGQRETQAPSWAGNPKWGSISGPWDRGLSPRQTLHPLSHSGTPKLTFLLEKFFCVLMVLVKILSYRLMHLAHDKKTQYNNTLHFTRDINPLITNHLISLRNSLIPENFLGTK